MIDVQNALGIYEGMPGNLILTYSQQHLATHKFYIAGRLTAWSIIHNGPGPRCLNKHLFKMMCGQNTSLEDLDPGVFMDEEIRKKVDEV